jgi:hypothetical protein
MAGVVFVVFIVLFILFLFSLFSIAEGRSNLLSSFMKGWRLPAGRPRSIRSTTAALQAMRRAGYEWGPDYVQVTDIGLLAYRHSEEPKIVRYNDVLLDTRFLRPFSELWLPYAVSGSVRFELIDSDGRLRYADEAEYDLVRGQNTLLPGTWLPLEGKSIPPGRWTLRLLTGDTVLAMYVFGWQTVGGGAIQRYITSDGEISPELQHALRSKPREAVSLSDLLADQDS